MLLSGFLFSQVPEYTFLVAVVHQVVLETSIYQIMVLLSPLVPHLVAFVSVSFAALTR